MVDVAGIRGAVGESAVRSMDALMAGAIRPLVSRAVTRQPPTQSGRRFAVIHLDGLSRAVLEEAIQRGYAPFLGRLVRSGAFRLSPAYSGAPASTPAFQAGLLYGLREPNIPGFLWLDRKTRREIRMDKGEDAASVERELAGQARSVLLPEGGTTSFSVFVGGADVNAYSRAGWGADEVKIISTGFDGWHLAAASVAHSLTAARILGRLAWEGAASAADLVRQALRVGRFQHEWTFLKNRVLLAVGAREWATFNAVMDIARGAPGIYTCFGDYDEIAHRRGPRSRWAMFALWGIDRAVSRIFAAAASAPEMNYDLYVVSDHGQVPTEPFERAAGLGLADYLSLAVPDRDGEPRLSEEAVKAVSRIRSLERAAVGALPGEDLKERARQTAVEAARSLAHSRRDGEALTLLDQLAVVEAGDIAHVYLGRGDRPLSLEEIERRFPRALQVIIRAPQVGMVAVRGGRSGYVFYRGRKIDLADPGEVAALDIGYGGARVAEFLAHMLRIERAGDLIAYGNGLRAGDVAFAWEFGSHAGLAKEEVETFVVHPANSPYDFSRVSHGADLNTFFMDAYHRRDKGRVLH